MKKESIILLLETIKIDNNLIIKSDGLYDSEYIKYKENGYYYEDDGFLGNYAEDVYEFLFNECRWVRDKKFWIETK